MSVDVIRKAFQATEEGFLLIVAKQWTVKPQLAAVGTCCLVGVICHGTFYIANAGDLRAVLGRGVKATGEVIAIQLSVEHNASIESIRQELHTLHLDDLLTRRSNSNPLSYVLPIYLSKHLLFCFLFTPSKP
ncbi:putative protein-serine/threonine phosphatase [Helianthus annuus]|nr:putative protein-serine/threonine phosphatase [Helianthus annuus]KAJ0435043.1 putative protein-serine/threonine phosphatase [Helianthus annuus]KAJ0814704.1 putative protein-serine/threonine phosphatase [Helianthus annuus]KAJ0814705.1 putative protein-serine/threonine phosphatase [Helianthus annuus]